MDKYQHQKLDHYQRLQKRIAVKQKAKRKQLTAAERKQRKRESSKRWLLKTRSARRLKRKKEYIQAQWDAMEAKVEPTDEEKAKIEAKTKKLLAEQNERYNKVSHMKFNTFLGQPSVKKTIAKYKKDNGGIEQIGGKFSNPDKCDENIHMHILCDDVVCKNKDCHNRWADLPWALTKCAPVKEEGMGIGLKAFEEIEEGEVIGPYVGIFTSRRPATSNLYIVAMGEQTGIANETWIDSEKTGNNTRYINCSCRNRKPNCILEKKLYQNQKTGWVVAVKKINIGDYLCYDYGPEYTTPCKCMQCTVGST